jgi:hypothetical protein
VTENEERLARWKEITGHIIAISLTIGFFTIAFVSIIGIVDIKDATTATFVGTVAGYSIGQLSRPLAYYFSVPRKDELEEKNHEHTNGRPR